MRYWFPFSSVSPEKKSFSVFVYRFLCRSKYYRQCDHLWLYQENELQKDMTIRSRVLKVTSFWNYHLYNIRYVLYFWYFWWFVSEFHALYKLPLLQSDIAVKLLCTRYDFCVKFRFDFSDSIPILRSINSSIYSCPQLEYVFYTQWRIKIFVDDIRLELLQSFWKESCCHFIVHSVFNMIPFWEKFTVIIHRKNRAKKLYQLK